METKTGAWLSKLQVAIYLHQLLVFVFLVAGIATTWTTIMIMLRSAGTSTSPVDGSIGSGDVFPIQDPDATAALDPTADVGEQQPAGDSSSSAFELTTALMIGPVSATICDSINGMQVMDCTTASVRSLDSETGVCRSQALAASGLVATSIALVILYGLVAIAHGFKSLGDKAFLLGSASKSVVVLVFLIAALAVFGQQPCGNEARELFAPVVAVAGPDAVRVATTTGAGVGLTAVALIIEFFWFLPFLAFRSKAADSDNGNFTLMP